MKETIQRNDLEVQSRSSEYDQQIVYSLLCSKVGRRDAGRKRLIY